MSTSTDRLAPYFEAYPEKIKHRRLELGLTVKALSQKSGVPYSNVSRVNSGGQANPLLFNEAAIADCLGLSLDQLCGLKTPVEDDSSLRKRIHELELSDAQKDAEIQRLSGAVNTANAKADGFASLDKFHTEQLNARNPLILIQFILNVTLVFFLCVYLVIDARIRDAGLIQFGNFSIFAWGLIAVILAASCTIAITGLKLIKVSKSEKQ